MRETISLATAISLIVPGGYIFFEPQITTGQWNTLFGSPVFAAATTTETIITLTVAAEITMNCSSSVTLSPNLHGQTGGTATSSFGCIVTTNNNAGYTLTIRKDQKLQIADVANQRFDDYTTSTGETDWTWDNVGAGNEEFGFAVNSCASTTDVVQKHRDNAADTCATSTSVTAWHCWYPIPSNPTTEQVIDRSSATPPAGILTTFGLQAQAGSANALLQGTYNCTTTMTVTTK